MNNKNKLAVVLSVLLPILSPVAGFAQTTPPANNPSWQNQNHGQPGHDNNGGNHDRDNDHNDRHDNDNHHDNDNNHGRPGHGNGDNHDNRWNNWNRNNWRGYNWGSYNWRNFSPAMDIVTGRVVDVSLNSVLVAGSNGQTYLVNTSNARITGPNGRPMPTFRLRMGDRVVISGIERANTIFATAIKDLSL